MKYVFMVLVYFILLSACAVPIHAALLLATGILFPLSDPDYLLVASYALAFVTLTIVTAEHA